MSCVIGLTGGIASGKSTVSTMLLSMGFPVIDADIIAKKVVEIGEQPYLQIIDSFGEEIVNEDKSINRAKLGSIIFHDEDKRKQLNEIVHPAVRKRMIKEKEHYLAEGEKAVFLDIPLLFESNLTHLVDKTMLVFVDEEIQVQRLMARNDLSLNEARARISSQMPLMSKVHLADAVINNNGTTEHTQQQLIEILKEWNIITYV
ncbi:dephospho-CoA kinase [Bacillus sp. PS06]|uniref:dephospho-CoA kinase n=1 Tax=Bacillus sp. PS06 TaxID=2764176 RepID=UPI0017837745|nr:dephospho-CoA kinase [Bacillus sp. PS06]MBD8068936.1 dephospho-CoA kinase [Bacillus sp. PS06]